MCEKTSGSCFKELWKKCHAGVWRSVLDCCKIISAQMGIAENADIKAVADSTNIITKGCFEPLTHEDIYEILKACL